MNLQFLSSFKGAEVRHLRGTCGVSSWVPTQCIRNPTSWWFARGWAHSPRQVCPPNYRFHKLSEFLWEGKCGVREPGAKTHTGGMTPLLPGNPLFRLFLKSQLSSQKARGDVGAHQSLALVTLCSWKVFSDTHQWAKRRLFPITPHLQKCFTHSTIAPPV